jgi:hypothetical protein
MLPRHGRIIGARLTEDEIADFNQFLKRNHFANLADFLRSTLKRNDGEVGLAGVVNKLEEIVNKIQWMGRDSNSRPPACKAVSASSRTRFCSLTCTAPTAFFGI